MTGHDLLCGLSQACSEDDPSHGYCGLSEPRFCIHCHTWCICDELTNAEQRMLSKCVEVVSVKRQLFASDEYRDAADTILVALRALAEKP